MVLGLASTKTPQLEDVDKVVARIDEVAQCVDIDNLAVSRQYGFASVAKGGNKLSQQDQFRKLRIVADAAISAWAWRIRLPHRSVVDGLVGGRPEVDEDRQPRWRGRPLDHQDLVMSSAGSLHQPVPYTPGDP